MRSVFLIAGLLLVLPAAGEAGAAPGDRRLIVRAEAVRSLPARYANISTVACAPDRKSATAVRGGVRYWQRFWCTGRTYQRVPFRLRFDTTGTCAACWTISHLSGTKAADLRVKPAPPAPAVPATDYPGLGGGHYVSEIAADALGVRLEDGSLWLVDPGSRAVVATWLPLAHITVRTGTDGSYGYRLVNTDEQEVANARFRRYD